MILVINTSIWNITSLYSRMPPMAIKKQPSPSIEAALSLKNKLCMALLRRKKGEKQAAGYKKTWVPLKSDDEVRSAIEDGDGLVWWNEKNPEIACIDIDIKTTKASAEKRSKHWYKAHVYALEHIAQKMISRGAMWERTSSGEGYHIYLRQPSDSKRVLSNKSGEAVRGWAEKSIDVFADSKCNVSIYDTQNVPNRLEDLPEVDEFALSAFGRASSGLEPHQDHCDAYLQAYIGTDEGNRHKMLLGSITALRMCKFPRDMVAKAVVSALNSNPLEGWDEASIHQRISDYWDKADGGFDALKEDHQLRKQWSGGAPLEDDREKDIMDRIIQEGNYKYIVGIDQKGTASNWAEFDGVWRQGPRSYDRLMMMLHERIKEKKLTASMDRCERIASVMSKGLMRELSEDRNEWDADHRLIGLQDGRVLETDTDRVRPQRKEDKILRRLNVRGTHTKTSQLWLKTLKQWIPDKATREFLQVAFGYSLLRNMHKPQDAILYFVGTGGSGKSTLLNTICNVIGDDGVYRFPERVLTQSGEGNHLTEMHRFAGKMLGVSPDLSGVQVNAGRLKSLSGERVGESRGIGEDMSKVPYQFMLCLQSNENLDLRRKDESITRRLNVITMSADFSAARNPDLARQLEQEAEGIFHWMREGLVKFMAEGKLDPSPKMLADQLLSVRGHGLDLTEFLGMVLVDKDNPQANLNSKTNTKTLRRLYGHYDYIANREDPTEPKPTMRMPLKKFLTAVGRVALRGRKDSLNGWMQDRLVKVGGENYRIDGAYIVQDPEQVIEQALEGGPLLGKPKPDVHHINEDFSDPSDYTAGVGL